MSPCQIELEKKRKIEEEKRVKDDQRRQQVRSTRRILRLGAVPSGTVLSLTTAV
jgi:hypothetical protein